MADKYSPLNNNDERSIKFIENKSTTYDILKSAFIDGIATFFWLLAILLTNDINKFVPALYIIVMVFGNLSGAHFNPCVTFSLWIYKGDLLRKQHILKFLSYVIFQLIFGTLGAALGYYLDNDNYEPSLVDMEYVLRPILVETFFTGTLIFVVLMINSTSTRPTDYNYVNVFILTVWLLYIFEAGKKYGGGYNPTGYFAKNIVYTIGKQVSYLDDAWIRLIFPFVGSLIATMLFKYVYRPFYASKDHKVIHEAEE
jgi:glycerol uptake facilitator-like aquaporin